MMRVRIIGLVLFVLAVGAQADYPWGSTEGKTKDEFLDGLLDQLTIEELAQQLSLVPSSQLLDNNGNGTKYVSDTSRQGVGEMNFWTPPTVENFNALQKLQIENARIPLPILLTGECIHGLLAANSTIFPINNNLANTFDLDLVNRVAKAIAIETRGRGLHGCYAPVLDLTKDPRWGRNGENFGEDKILAAKMGVSYILGLQDNGNLTSLESVFATIKHFIAHGVPDGGRNIAPAHLGQRQLWNEYGVPFRDAVELGGAKGLMMSYNTIDGVPTAFDTTLYDRFFNEWGFDGRVLSDDHDINRAYLWSRAADSPQAAIAKWLNAGGSTNYADWPTSQWVSYIVDAINQGLVTKDTLTLRVKAQLGVKYDLGLFDNPYYPANFTDGKLDRDSAAALSQEASEKCIVMLKNTGILPLSNSTGKIALIGPFADTDKVLHGGYAGTGIQHRIRTLRQGVLSNIQDVDKLQTAWGATAFLDYRAEIIPMYAVKPSSNESGVGWTGTYYYDTNFTQVAYVRKNDATLLQWDVTPPINGPGGRQVLQNNTFSVRWEGILTSPVSTLGALGANVANGWATLYVDGKYIANATSGSLLSSYGDGPTGAWSYMENNSTNVPPGLAEFKFVEGRTYKIRLDFVTGGSAGNVYPAWNLVDREDGVGAAVEVAKQADIIVLAVGYDMQSDSETNDLSEIILPANQTKLADAIYALGKPVILVAFGPRPKAITDFYMRSEAVLHAGYPGQAGGQVISDILYGKVNPSGKLSVTVPYAPGTIPAFYNHEGSDYHYWYRELSQRTLQGNLLTYGVYGAGYLYNPAYHFGYGLSYTKFQYSQLACDATTFGSNDTITLTFTVTNTGTMAGRDVPQIYLLWRYATVAQPRLQLHQFASVELAPGEAKDVTLQVDVARHLTGYNDKMEWGVDASKGAAFTFALMQHSGDAQTNNVTLTFEG